MPGILSFWFIKTIFQKISNISNILKNGLNEPKNQISLLPRHAQLSPIILSEVIGYSQIKIDHFADSLLKLQIRIGVHLIYKCWTDTTPYSALCTAHRVMNEAWKQKMTCFCVCSTGHFCSFVIHFICV